MSTPRPVTIELLDEIQAGFNEHDVAAILSHFTEDCEWLMARGPQPWEGQRWLGKAAIGASLEARYKVIPDMRWEDMSHFISADGTKACSEWTVRGTPLPGHGEAFGLLGCDIWTFRDGWVTKKDTYWKYVG